jgi:hypothetical protein
LRDLEGWRGQAFEGQLKVRFVPRTSADGEVRTCWWDSAMAQLMVVEGENKQVGREDLVRGFLHALQDQRFALARLQAGARDEDAARAATALIEGEEALAVSELVPYGRRAKLPARGPVSPEVFAEVFNDSAGQDFVRALRDAGGWERVDAAFREPPLRTAEILRPSRYLKQTRAHDEGELFTAWRLTPYVVGDYEGLGAYEVQRFLASSELTRGRSEELAAAIMAAKRLRHPETIWVLLLADTTSAHEMQEAAWSAGATDVAALSPDRRMISFRPPAAAPATQP